MLTNELRNALARDAGIPDKLEIVAAGKRGDRVGILEIDSGGFPSNVLVVEGMQIVQLYQRPRIASSLSTFAIIWGTP